MRCGGGKGSRNREGKVVLSFKWCSDPFQLRVHVPHTAKWKKGGKGERKKEEGRKDRDQFSDI